MARFPLDPKWKQGHDRQRKTRTGLDFPAIPSLSIPLPGFLVGGTRRIENLPDRVDQDLQIQRQAPATNVDHVVPNSFVQK